MAQEYKIHSLKTLKNKNNLHFKSETNSIIII
jgi:hypothetical protein